MVKFALHSNENTAFFIRLSSEVEKVSEFLSLNIDETKLRISAIEKNIEAYHSRKMPGTPVSDLEFNFPKSSNSTIEQAILELYRHLDLLKNFSRLNSVALTKILKKWDKVCYLILFPRL
jgi:SPX domain protein involved in polyphosphate accumulation